MRVFLSMIPVPDINVEDESLPLIEIERRRRKKRKKEKQRAALFPRSSQHQSVSEQALAIFPSTEEIHA